MGTYAVFDLTARYLKPDLGFEPLTVLINQGNQGNGNVANLGGQPRDLVKAIIGGGIKDVIAPQQRKPHFLLFDQGCFHASYSNSIYIEDD